MKVNKILKITAVALCGVMTLSGCIRETFPQTSTVTQEQLGQSSAGLDASLKGIPSSLMLPSYDPSGNHGDFGYMAHGVWLDHMHHLITPCTVWSGGPQYADRFQHPFYGFGMGSGGAYTYMLWYQNYPNIKNFNDMIAAVGDNEANAEYRGIAKTFRAMLYMDMARLYDPLPAYAPDNGSYNTELEGVKELTVPIVTETTTEKEAANNPRATREEIFEFIFADLDDAAVCLENYVPTSPNYPSLAAVYALYARAYLWLGGFEEGLYENVPTGKAAYELAADYARKCIDEAGGAIMSEAEWTNPRTAFNTKASSWIWCLQMSTDTVYNNLISFAAHMCPEGLYGYGIIAQPGVTKMMYERMSDTDFRKSVIYGPDMTYEDFKEHTTLSKAEFEDGDYKVSPYTNFKFRPNGGEHIDYMTANAITYPLIRLEEMYFIEMEATAHFNEAGAWDLLYAFMANRDSNYACKTQDLVNEIIFQKQVEFWGEGHTLYDFKRLNYGIDTSNPQDYPVGGANFYAEGRLPWWNTVIPLGEIQVNLGIQANNPDPSGALKSATALPE